MTTRVNVEITLRVSMKRVQQRGHADDIYQLHKIADRWERRHGVGVYTYERTTALVETPIDHTMGWARYVITLASRGPRRTATELRDIARIWGPSAAEPR